LNVINLQIIIFLDIVSENAKPQLANDTSKIHTKYNKNITEFINTEETFYVNDDKFYDYEVFNIEQTKIIIFLLFICSAIFTLPSLVYLYKKQVENSLNISIDYIINSYD